MGKCKTKAIQANLGIFIHISAYSGVSGHMRPGIFGHIRSPVWRWYIRGPGAFGALAGSEPVAYSGPWRIRGLQWRTGY